MILLTNQVLAAAARKGGPTISQDTITSLLSVGMFQYMAWYGYSGCSVRAIKPRRHGTAWVAALGAMPDGVCTRAADHLGRGYRDRHIFSADGWPRPQAAFSRNRAARSLGTRILGHQLFGLFALPLLRAETAVVGMMVQMVQTGVDWHDNIVIGKRWSIVVYPYCSSFHNLSLALLCWVTISLLACNTWRRRDFAVAGVIGITMILMHLMRLFIMSLNENLYHYWRDGTGNQIFAVASVVVLLVSLFAGRRAGECG